MSRLFSLRLKNFLLVASLYLGSGVFFYWFFNSQYFEGFEVWSHQHVFVLFITIVIVKFIGLIWPPLPGGLLAIAAVPVLGWEAAYLADLSGTVLGICAAYYLGSKYGYAILDKLFDEYSVEKIKEIKINRDKEFEGVFVLQVLGGSFMELLCYAMGLMKVGFWNFFFGTVLSHIVTSGPTFYLVDKFLSNQNTVLAFFAYMILTIVFWKVRKRYIS